MANDVRPLRYGGREGEWWVTYLPLSQHYEYSKYLVTTLPGCIAKATEGERKKCKALVLCMLTRMRTFAVARRLKRHEQSKNPSSQRGIFNLTDCPTARLQNQKQPRFSTPMKRTANITHDISAHSQIKRLIEWE